MQNKITNQNKVQNHIEYLLWEVWKYDKPTYFHSKRVACLSSQIASDLDFSKYELSEITKGALLHDIGKIFLPESLLNKVDPLTKVEREILSIHADLGYEKLIHDKIIWSDIVKNVVAKHHNPIILKNEITPSQIVNAADIFDALTNERPYRNFAYSDKEAFEIMADMIEPDVMNLFFEQRKNKIV